LTVDVVEHALLWLAENLKRHLELHELLSRVDLLIFIRMIFPGEITVLPLEVVLIQLEEVLWVHLHDLVEVLSAVAALHELTVH